MTDEEKEKYRDGLIATCKVYCHIDYDDDMEILELMFDAVSYTHLVQVRKNILYGDKARPSEYRI